MTTCFSSVEEQASGRVSRFTISSISLSSVRVAANVWRDAVPVSPFPMVHLGGSGEKHVFCQTKLYGVVPTRTYENATQMARGCVMTSVGGEGSSSLLASE
jgi:hypothetical protein